MNAQDPLVTLNEKMDTLIRIQATLAIKSIDTQKDKIAFLYGAGLGPSYIASLLGVKPSTVSGAMAKHKKSISAKGETSNE